MRIPRVRIADLMVLVLIVALDAAAVRAYDTDSEYALLALGALPMANVLAFAWLLGRQRRRVRPYLACGVVALAAFIILATCFPDGTVGPYLNLFFDPFGAVAKRYGSIDWHGPIDVVGPPFAVPLVVIVVLLVPQLALALIGGFVVAAARRRCRPPTAPT